jgi:hypothetical protein
MLALAEDHWQYRVRLQTLMTRLQLGLASLLSTALVSAALSQCTPGGPPNPPAVERAITGIVMDSAHNVLENAAVFVIDSARNVLEHATPAVARPTHEVRTNARGIFQITDLEPGTYRLTVRRIGYDIAVQSYIVTDSGGVARFCLLPDIQNLPTMITSVPRGGITGVVGDSALSLVKGAEVRVFGENKFALSDSAGGFFLAVKPGEYTVLVKKKGYGPQIVAVTVPKDSGRKIVVWLGSPPRNPNSYANEIEAMRQRILLTPSSLYHRVTSEELALSALNLDQIVRVKAQTIVRDDCEAAIAGMGFTLPLYMLDKDEISMLEVVSPRMTSAGSGQLRGVTSINGNAPIPNQGQRTARGSGARIPECPAIIVWTKR